MIKLKLNEVRNADKLTRELKRMGESIMHTKQATPHTFITLLVHVNTATTFIISIQNGISTFGRETL